ncbi:hypothetical protein ACFV6F_03755 [Kitasatospora phosalacinea]|uniref:hypothetical protein n=1 Tax=Kitasatospora phosalacinea TaxID=2065 RepID=UPI00364BE3E3
MKFHHNWIHDTNQRNPGVDNVAYAHLYDNYLQNVASYGNLCNDTSAAALTQGGSIVVNGTGRQQTSGTTFDPSSFYPYTLDAAADVSALLAQYAGPQGNIG